jgi:hypothetical protein
VQSLRPFFHWQYSGVLIPLFFGTALALALAGEFRLAYAFVVLFALWIICYWLSSDFLAHRKQALEKRPVKRDAGRFKGAVRAFRVIKWSVTAAFLGISFLCGWFVYSKQLEKELGSLHGWLLPANDALPSNPCSHVPDDALLVYMGFATSFTTRFPHTIIEVDNKPRLVIDRNPDNSLAISIDIFGGDGRIIAAIEKNQFTINEHNYFKITRTDRSSLLVVDEQKEEVLNVRYLNSRAIWINGILRYPGSNPVVFRGSGGGGLCTGEAGRAEIAIHTVER